MSRYLNPFTDYGFKNLFGKEYSKDVLIDFLNELYSDLPHMQRITDLRYNNKEKSRLTNDGKTVIYDIYCETSDKKHFIVEMQVNSQATFLSRAIYYLCRAISEQGEMGDVWQYDFEPVYGVYFTDFTLKNVPAKVKTHTMLCDIVDGKPISDKVCLSFIQFKYFDKTSCECTTGFDQWIYVLKNLETMERMPFTEEKKIFAKVHDISDLHRLNKEERQEYDHALKVYRDYNLVIRTATEEGLARGIEQGIAEGKAQGIAEGKAQGIAEGKAQGIAEGKAQGIAEGKAQGIEQGRSEGIEENKRNNAKSLLALNVDIDIISKATGLTPDEIRAL